MHARSVRNPAPPKTVVECAPGTTVRAQPGLSHGIAEQLQRLIYGGEIEPGERLNEAALALRMGTSRGPIREAIRVLAGIGLVLAVPNRGVFVREISVREMAEIYELRALLLGFAARQACDNLGDEQRLQGEQLLDGMDHACATGDGQAYYVQNLRFHALLLELTNNQRAQQAYEDHAKELHLFRRRYFDTSSPMRRSNAEHRRIFEAVLAGAKDRAGKLAQAHVLQGRQRLLATLEVSAGNGTAGALFSKQRRRKP